MKSFTSLLLVIDHHQQIFVDELHLMWRQSSSWKGGHLTYELVVGKYTLPLQQSIMLYACSTHWELKHR